MSDEKNLKSVPLEKRHVELGARMVPFAGYSMPVQYEGIKTEHEAVRTSAGLFDVSHMGRVYVTGKDAIAAVDRLVTNDVSKLVDGRAHYTVMCNDAGGIIDDLVIYRLTADRLLLCLNAANRDADLAHIEEHLSGDVELDDQSDQTLQLAIQGPKAQQILQQLTDYDLGEIKFFRCKQIEVAGVTALVARTGYTGEDGFELYLPGDGGEKIFDALVTRQDEGLAMCGLGCRDTLRLEAGLLLHGQDIDQSTNPLEAGLGWLVKFDKESDFIGRQALEKVREQGVKRELRGLILEGRGVLRPGYPIEVDGTEVGQLTSGSYSPTLEASIGLGYIDKDAARASDAEVRIRRRTVAAKIVDFPFYRRPKKS